MIKNRLADLWILITLLSLGAAAQASNLTQESNIAREIAETLRQGETVKLISGNQQFLGIVQKTSRPTKLGAVIILHGVGQNPNSPGVIRTLRTGLTDSGWDTLALQMPIPVNNHEIDNPAELMQAAIPRIQSAIQYLTDEDTLNLGLVGYGLGGGSAAAFAALTELPTLRALGIISLDGTSESVIKHLEKQKNPVLDLYGSRDLSNVINTAGDRKRAIMQTAENPHFRQIKVAGADPMYTGLQQQVLSLMRGWLAKYAAGTGMR